MKEQFRKKTFHKKSQILLDQTQLILEEYGNQSIELTLRQLYYQLVSRNLIENSEKSYKRISGLVNDARYCGIIDWDDIKDRTRSANKPSQFDGLPDLINAACNSYRLNRWQDQRYYLELFAEKDAIFSVLNPITSKYHISLNIVRGFSSSTAIHEASQRFIEAGNEGQKPILLYVGDHDPSGLDMIRDVTERIGEFCSSPDFVRIIPVALTMEQIKKYNPPPNRAKKTDPRIKDYITKFGNESWEVDALEPKIMQKIVTDSIIKYLDLDKFQAVIDREEEDKEKLLKLNK